MRRPSVTFINRVYTPDRGASGRLLRDLAVRFSRAGWQVNVITTGKSAAKQYDGAIRVIRVKGPDKPKGSFSYGLIWLKMMFVALRQKSPNLVVTQSDPPLLAILGQIISLLKGAHHIHWCHDVYPELFSPLDIKFPKFILKSMCYLNSAALKKADQIVVIGRCMAQYFLSQGFDEKKIVTIQNWSNGELNRDQAQRPSIKNHKGLAPEKLSYDCAKPFTEQLKEQPKFRVLYAGNIGLAHPLDTILDAAEILSGEHPEIEFVFVGDGPRFDMVLRERLRRRINNIRLMPYQPPANLRSIMESGDLHLVSLKNEAEGFAVPCKIYSAFAVQRPCVFVGPSGSEAAKAITDFNAGTVVEHGKATDLAACIKGYRLDGDLWFAAQKGAAEAGIFYAPDKFINAWLALAGQVVQGDEGVDMQDVNRGQSAEKPDLEPEDVKVRPKEMEAA